MNSLSWFLYFAGVVGNISFVLCLVAIVLIATSIIFSFSVFIDSGDKPPKSLIWCFVGGFTLMLFVAFVPSKNTMYAIAASELGQKAVESELGGKAFKAVEQWINEQVKK